MSVVTDWFGAAGAVATGVAALLAAAQYRQQVKRELATRATELRTRLQGLDAAVDDLVEQFKDTPVLLEQSLAVEQAFVEFFSSRGHPVERAIEDFDGNVGGCRSDIGAAANEIHRRSGSIQVSDEIEHSGLPGNLRAVSAGALFMARTLGYVEGFENIKAAVDDIASLKPHPTLSDAGREVNFAFYSRHGIVVSATLLKANEQVAYIRAVASAFQSLGDRELVSAATSRLVDPDATREFTEEIDQWARALPQILPADRAAAILAGATTLTSTTLSDKVGQVLADIAAQRESGQAGASPTEDEKGLPEAAASA